MTMEGLYSVTQAICIAREARKEGKKVPIVPCNACPSMDQSLTTLCRDPEGIMADNGALLCPRQKGQKGRLGLINQAKEPTQTQSLVMLR